MRNAENSRIGHADISSFRNYFALKTVFPAILWDGLLNSAVKKENRDLSATPPRGTLI